MSDVFNLILQAAHSWDYKTTLETGPVRDENAIGFTKKFTKGTGLYQAVKNWHARRTLAPSTNDDLTLTNLALAIFNGALPVVFTGVKGILVVNLTTVASTPLRIGNYGAGGFASPWGGNTSFYNDIYSESPFQQACNTAGGWVVTPSSNDILRLRNVSAVTTITYDISLMGI